MRVYHGPLVTFQHMRVYLAGVWQGIGHVQFARDRQPYCHSGGRKRHARVRSTILVIVPRVRNAIWVIDSTCLLVILGEIIWYMTMYCLWNLVRHQLWKLEKKYYWAGEVNSDPFRKPGKHSNNWDRKRKRSTCFENWIRRSIFFKNWSIGPNWRSDITWMSCTLKRVYVIILLERCWTSKARQWIQKKIAWTWADLGIRKELHLQFLGNRLVKPPACYTLPDYSKSYFCRYLKYVRLPDCYAIDFSKNISLKNE